MVDIVYVEHDVREHPRTVAILKRLKNAKVVEIERYSEVFNPKAQNFRLQKNNPALIIAKKHKGFVLPTPEGYGVGSDQNFYFSHMLNCLYDCRYCFLQGMYQSAHYLLFVNYEDFMQDIKRIAQQAPDKDFWFFSGYDCDSLAMEPITHFSDFALDAIREIPNAYLELRTKSTQIRHLLTKTPNPKVINAFSFTDVHSHQQLEKGVPSIAKRLAAMKKLQDHGWILGLRFDPLVYHPDYQQNFKQLLDEVFNTLDAASIHSVSLGVFRLPKQTFKNMLDLYPQEKLFNQSFDIKNNMISYEQSREDEMMDFCTKELLKYITAEQLFPCIF